jgi:2-polyprenyl-3-methyl-5-hydroxy-6-metoxy-1,4-benzoquinol methylase
MEEISFNSQEEKIRSFERGYRATHVINIGLHFGIFKALNLALEGMTAQELAVKLMLHEHYLKVWLQTAYHFEILDCDNNGRFRLQLHLAEILGIDPLFGPASRHVDFRADSTIQGDDQPPLYHYIRTGIPVTAHKSPESSLATSEATKGVYLVFLSMILPYYKDLEEMLQQGIGFLDIGCGSGNLIIELAHAFGQSRFVGVDPDIYGIERAQTTTSELGLDLRVSFEEMGAGDLPYNDEFNMICLVATLHEILPEVRTQAMEKVYQALKKEGKLLVLDYPYPGRLEDFRDPRYNYGVIEQYFEVVNGIVHLSAPEQDELLNQATK